MASLQERLSAGGGGGSTTDTTETIDTDQSIAQGDIINDVRAQVAGYEQDIEADYAGADTSTDDVATVDTGSTTVVDPDIDNQTTEDAVGITTTEETVSVTEQTNSGTETTTVQRGDAGDTAMTTDMPSPQNVAENVADQLGVGQLINSGVTFLQENATTVGALAAAATLASVVGLGGGD